MHIWAMRFLPGRIATNIKTASALTAGDLGNQLPGHSGSVNVSEVINDVARGQALGIQRQHALVETTRRRECFGTMCGSKVPLRSRGTEIVAPPISVRTVLRVDPLRKLPSA